MKDNNFRDFAKIPLKQAPNRVWRTYMGGSLIDEWRGTVPAADNHFPEEWIMSTISARGKNRPPQEGVSLLESPMGILSLKDLISSDLELFIGKRLAEKYGTTGLLIKLLDSVERLTIQVHPDKDFARTMLNSQFGKTESWYILGGREVNGEKSVIYLGFKEGITPEIWGEYYRNQDIQGMLESLHRFEVQNGDAFIIYGGVPHAIGCGCFLLEVQEPTDFTMRVEKITPSGLKIGDELIHQGIGDENMLKCFNYHACSFEEASRKWKILPEIMESSDSFCLKSIFNEKHTDCFSVSELELKGEYSMKCNDTFFVGVVYSGEVVVTCNENEYFFRQGDEVFFPAAIEQVSFRSTETTRILLCYPPSAYR